MKSVWQTSAKVLFGLLAAAMYATPQTSTVSARPGAVNYIEGAAYINGQPVSPNTLGQTFLEQNQTLTTDNGKAEVLLTPGVFLRVGSNSEIRMISPSLINTQVELDRGEAMIEVAQLVKDNNIQLLERGASVRFEKIGLYRVTADQRPVAQVIDGAAEVSLGDNTVKLGKGHETVITPSLKSQKFDRKQEDELYAWSNVRASYDARESYAAASRMEAAGYGPGYSGWFWNTGWNSWAWLPGAGYAYSPFGWGFYGPGYLGYAPFGYYPYRTVYVAPRDFGRGYWTHNAGTWVGHPAFAQAPAAHFSGGGFRR